LRDEALGKKPEFVPEVRKYLMWNSFE
jgi:hypothetical protein